MAEACVAKKRFEPLPLVPGFKRPVSGLCERPKGHEGEHQFVRRTVVYAWFDKEQRG